MLSGIMIFEHKIGFSVQNIANYYLGDAAQFINAKTYSGVLKTILPHIISFALFSMVLLHFLIFTKHRNKTNIKVLIFVMYMSAFVEIFSPMLILFGYEIFTYFKLLSFGLFMGTVFYTLWLLFRSIMNK